MAYWTNEIAKGFNNITGLVNIENIKPYQHYFVTVNDRNWSDGQSSIQGSGRNVDRGKPSTVWNASFLTDQQYWYIYTNILGGQRSGPVTIKTWRRAVPMASGMVNMTVICNGWLTLPPIPDASRYASGYTPFDWVFTGLVVIEGDKMYGDIYVTGGSTSQDNVGTTPVLLTAFATDGLSNGVTVSNSSDNLTVLVAGKWKPTVFLDFTSTGVSVLWTFTIYKNGATTGITGSVLGAATPLRQDIMFGNRYLDLAANDILTVYVETDVGAATPDITVIEGAFNVESISSV